MKRHQQKRRQASLFDEPEFDSIAPSLAQGLQQLPLDACLRSLARARQEPGSIKETMVNAYAAAAALALIRRVSRA